MKGKFTYTVYLTSAISNVSLPMAFYDVKNLRIKTVRYYTASANNKVMLINIEGWNDNCIYTDTTNNFVRNYTKMLPLPPNSGALYIFEASNLIADCTKDDVITTNVKSLNFVITIDGAFSSDISSGNPLVVEFDLWR